MGDKSVEQNYTLRPSPRTSTAFLGTQLTQSREPALLPWQGSPAGEAPGFLVFTPRSVFIPGEALLAHFYQDDFVLCSKGGSALHAASSVLFNYMLLLPLSWICRISACN